MMCDTAPIVMPSQRHSIAAELFCDDTGTWVGLRFASDDDPVAELVKSLSEPPADAARAASDENGVASQMHGLMLLLLRIGMLLSRARRA